MKRVDTVKLLMVRKPEVFPEEQRNTSKEFQRQRMNGIYITGVGLLIFAGIERVLLKRSILLRDARLQ